MNPPKRKKPPLNYPTLRDALLDLTMRGKLDALDLKIISARDCSPMPSLRHVARLLKIDTATVSRRMQHIKALILQA